MNDRLTHTNSMEEIANLDPNSRQILIIIKAKGRALRLISISNLALSVIFLADPIYLAIKNLTLTSIFLFLCIIVNVLCSVFILLFRYKIQVMKFVPIFLALLFSTILSLALTIDSTAVYGILSWPETVALIIAQILYYGVPSVFLGRYIHVLKKK